MAELVGRIMVDSGQVMVGDPCYIQGGWKDEGFNPDAIEKAPYPFTYAGASSATCSEKRFGLLAEGVGAAVSSGYGDGSYPVYVERDSFGRVISLHVYFEDDPNEATCPECGTELEDADYECSVCSVETCAECGLELTEDGRCEGCDYCGLCDRYQPGLKGERCRDCPEEDEDS